MIELDDNQLIAAAQSFDSSKTSRRNMVPGAIERIHQDLVAGCLVEQFQLGFSAARIGAYANVAKMHGSKSSCCKCLPAKSVPPKR